MKHAALDVLPVANVVEPGGQAVHAVALRVLLYEPAGQSRGGKVGLAQYDPGVDVHWATHEALPIVDVKPAGQAVQDVALAMLLYEPGGQSWGVAAGLGQNDPGAEVHTHEEPPAARVVEPVGQAVHDVTLATLLKKPMGQSWGAAVGDEQNDPGVDEHAVTQAEGEDEPRPDVDVPAGQDEQENDPGVAVYVPIGHS